MAPVDEMTGGPNEVWSYGEVATPVIAEALRLRERLRPYIHEQMHEASVRGLPPSGPRVGPFVTRWRSRTVAKVRSIGFVVRRWTYCAAG